jgi:hypothetical protein
LSVQAFVMWWPRHIFILPIHTFSPILHVLGLCPLQTKMCMHYMGPKCVKTWTIFFEWIGPRAGTTFALTVITTMCTYNVRLSPWQDWGEALSFSHKGVGNIEIWGLLFKHKS